DRGGPPSEEPESKPDGLSRNLALALGITPDSPLPSRDPAICAPRGLAPAAKPGTYTRRLTGAPASDDQATGAAPAETQATAGEQSARRPAAARAKTKLSEVPPAVPVEAVTAVPAESTPAREAEPEKSVETGSAAPAPSEAQQSAVSVSPRVAGPPSRRALAPVLGDTQVSAQSAAAAPSESEVGETINSRTQSPQQTAAVPARPNGSPETLNPPAPPGSFEVQFAALRSVEAARGFWARLRTQYPELMGDRGLRLRSVNLGQRGVYFRVRTGPFSDIEEARNLCRKWRAVGRDCLAVPAL
ncbi:MAG TPA: SPOR domain-containing protein, partial [Kiloniellales bacterium]|nr:SPOR domain-containing protein [Kiloniellales bacterium]